HHGQLWHPQDGHHPAMVRAAPAIPSTLYADLRIVAQSRRALVCGARDEATEARGARQRALTRDRHSRLHRRVQHRGPAVRVDEDGRRDSREHRALRASNSDRSRTSTSYVANHWYGTLGQLHITVKNEEYEDDVQDSDPRRDQRCGPPAYVRD